MTNLKATKKALVSSVLALVMCFTMLLGTTFAWFTDSVTSANNVIQTGTLDIGLSYSNDNSNWTEIDEDTDAVFNYKYWEPGYTDMKYVKISNNGTLAFKFQLNIVPNIVPAAGEPNLADVIDVYMFAADATVDRAAIAAATPVGTLSDLMAENDGAAHGILLPAEGKGSTDVNTAEAADAPRGEITYCIVLKMQDEAGNEYQNLSVGNGFALQLFATQYTWENDSFDHLYDDGAKIVIPPMAEVVVNDGKWIETVTHDDIWMNTSFQFKPEHTHEEALEHPYGLYHADFVVKADKDIPAESVILPGYYAAYCDTINGKWVGLSSSDVIPAGTEIRLIRVLSDAFGSDITVNYEDICKFGNDGTGFLCGVSAVDVDGDGIYDAAGATLTVELRLYEVPAQGDCAEGGGCKHRYSSCELGADKYITIGTYGYTIPTAVEAVESSIVEGVNELNNALNNGENVVLKNNVTVSSTETGSNGYGATGTHIGNGQTFDGNGNSFGVNAWNTWDAAINITSGTIKNVTVNSGMRGIFISHNGTAGKVYLENVIIDGTIYTISCDQGTNSGLEAKDCTFNGWTSYAATTGDVLFTDCSFGEGQGYAYCRPYATTTFVGCDFEAGFVVDADYATITFENCTIGGVALTADNLATLVAGNISNVTVK